MKAARRIILSAAIVLLTLFLLQRLLVPKYATDVVEGAFVAEYYQEKNKDFDVIFVGDCEVYENFSPVTLWEKYGIHSYIRGSAEQYVWQSYYLLEDTLRYHTPKVVIFNIQAMQFNESQNEAYNRMTLEGMEWSMSKVNAIFASLTEKEQFLDYVFPILRYHTRWSELTTADVQYLLDSKPVSHNGYYMRVDVKPAENVPGGKIRADYSFEDKAWNYLSRMAQLCRDNGIQLILIKAPSLYPYWYPEWERQIETFAQEQDLPYINFLELTEDIGIDYSTDTYDAGLHMNLSGAEKLSTYLGQVLQTQYDITDRRGDTELENIWADNIAAYEAEQQAQYEQYGITPPAEKG